MLPLPNLSPESEISLAVRLIFLNLRDQRRQAIPNCRLYQVVGCLYATRPPIKKYMPADRDTKKPPLGFQIWFAPFPFLAPPFPDAPSPSPLQRIGTPESYVHQFAPRPRPDIPKPSISPGLGGLASPYVPTRTLSHSVAHSPPPPAVPGSWSLEAGHCPSGRSGLRPSLVRGDSPRNAPLTKPAVAALRGDSRKFVDKAVALDVTFRVSGLSHSGRSGRSGLRPSLVRGDSPRNAPLTPLHPPPGVASLRPCATCDPAPRHRACAIPACLQRAACLHGRECASPADRAFDS